MKTIIQKRADQLEVGDIIGVESDRHVVLSATPIIAQYMQLRTIPIVGGGKVCEWEMIGAEKFSTEVDQLTPAQQHADELLDLLKQAATYDEDNNAGPTPAWLRLAKNLMIKIDPVEPPTLQETLDALLNLVDGAGAVMAGTWDKHSMQVERTAAHDIIRRARATGVLK